MNTQVKGCYWLRCVWMLVAMAGLSMPVQSSALADETKKTIGISPLVSNVGDIPAEGAQELFINALMRTNHFSILPPDAKGSFTGVDFVFEPTISEGKSKANVFGFLKDTVTSNAPISLDVRVFDPRTAALVSMVTVNSSEIKSEKMGLGDLQSVMGAVGGGGQQSSDASKLEERIDGVMLQAANRLAGQLGGPAGGGGMSRPRAGAPRTPFTR